MDETLKKEVEKLISQRYSESEIKGLMTEKGYSLDEINEVISNRNSNENQKKKINIKKILIFSISIILAYIAISMSVIMIVDKYKGTDAYQSKPENWVTKDGENTLVNVESIPGGVSIYDGDLQQFNDGKISTAFINEGWYNGTYFRNDYFSNNNKIISIGDNINSNDDVMNVFITEIFYNDTPYFDIFLDSKWKENLGTVNIIYGKDFENFKEFNFSLENEIGKEVFHNRIKDDINRFNVNTTPTQSQGGLMLGNMTREDWINRDPYGKVIIKLS